MKCICIKPYPQGLHGIGSFKFEVGVYYNYEDPGEPYSFRVEGYYVLRPHFRKYFKDAFEEKMDELLK